jgi:hypothetical protein
MTGANFQQQSRFRKFVYFGIILVLFAVTLGIRNFPRYGLNDQAETLSIRDEDLGEGDLTSQAIRLSLVGSRGITICGLWAAAQDKQAKHKWNELELIVRSLTKLQPHFIAPWRFQSWNLAYNVSVESDRVKDKFYHITRGIDLAAEGERKNKNNPDLRWDVGYFHQDKIGIADEANTLSCLFQLSCIDPIERNPEKFRSHGSSVVDHMDQFKEFCEKHPMLVRRLRETLRCKEPEDIVDFLEANRKLPSRFEELRPGEVVDTTPLKSPEDQFPPLPPSSQYGSRWNDPNIDSPSSDLGDSFDHFMVARAWFSYSQDPLNNTEHPRKPKLLATVIFRGQPCRAQHYVAEKLEKEGWFDSTGWEIPNWKFSSRPGGPMMLLTVGKGVSWAEEAWKKAYDMTLFRGEESKLNLTPEEIRSLSPPDLRTFTMDSRLSNYPYFIMKARVEKTRDAITARKLFRQAGRLDDVGDYDQAKPIYEDPGAFGPPSSWENPKSTSTGWRKVLIDNEDFADDDDVKQETYIFQHQYKHSLSELAGPFYKQLVVLNDALGQCTLWPANMPLGLRVPWYTPSIQIHRRLHAQVKGPFDRLNPRGLKFIDEENERVARSTLGLFDFSALRQMTPENQERMRGMMESEMEKRKARSSGGAEGLGTIPP